MKHHLSSLELVDAVEGQLASTRHERHLETCDRCRSSVSELRAVMTHVASAEVPEPSPLFWDHFSQRVRAATRDVAPAREAWWSSGWRPIVGVAAVLVALFLAVEVRQRPGGPGGQRIVASDELSVPAVPSAAAEDESLDVVARMTSSMSFEELQLAAQPTPDATDALVAQLSSRERAELVRLINTEKGSSE
jgi:hypothetical protein